MQNCWDEASIFLGEKDGWGKGTEEKKETEREKERGEELDLWWIRRQHSGWAWWLSLYIQQR